MRGRGGGSRGRGSSSRPVGCSSTSGFRGSSTSMALWQPAAVACRQQQWQWAQHKGQQAVEVTAAADSVVVAGRPAGGRSQQQSRPKLVCSRLLLASSILGCDEPSAAPYPSQPSSTIHPSAAWPSNSWSNRLHRAGENHQSSLPILISSL